MALDAIQKSDKIHEKIKIKMKYEKVPEDIPEDVDTEREPPWASGALDARRDVRSHRFRSLPVKGDKLVMGGMKDMG